MPKHIQLDVPKLCHENWDKMTPVEKGRFCDSCQKQVVDFTSMSDSQVAAFFRKPSTGSVCGRFMPDQLNRDLEIPKKRIPWVKYFFQFALPAFLASAKATAQGNTRVLTGDTIIVSKQVQGKLSASASSDQAGIKNIIEGKVVDEQNNPVAYASIMIKGTKCGMEADSLGGFSLNYESVVQNITLEISSVGFDNKEMVLEPGKTSGIIVKMSAKQELPVIVTGYGGTIRGKVVLGGAISVTKCTIYKEKKKEANPFLNTLDMKTYPNPVSIGSSINILCNKIEEDNYSVELLSLSGQVIMKKKVWIDGGARVLNIQLPSVSAGTYLLKVLNNVSGKNYTEKLVVQ